MRCAISAIVFLEDKTAEIGSLEFALSVMKVYEAALMSRGRRVAIPR